MDFEGFQKEETAGIFDYLKTKGATGYIVIYNEAYFTGVPEEPEIIPEQTQPNQPVVPVQPVTPQQPSASENEESSENKDKQEEEIRTGWVEESPGIKDFIPEG